MSNTTSTAGTITFAGIGSGIDVNSLISGLVTAAKAPETGLQTNISDAQTKISTLGDLVTKLQSLQNLAQAFTLRSGAVAMSATSSNDAQVQVSATSSASAGSYTVKVNSLAAAASFQSSTFDTDTAGVAGSGTLQIAIGNEPAVTVTYGIGESLSDIASKINGAHAGVTATVLDDGSHYRLIVTAQSTGVAATPTFTETGSGLGLSSPTAALIPAQDASISLNGIAITRPTNVLSDVIPGLTMTLAGTTPTGSPGVTVGVANDPGSLETQVKGLVDAYNAVASAMSAQLTYNGSTMGPDTLFGDPALQSLQRELGGLFAAGYSHGSGTESAADYGITLNKDGTLALDASKFDNAVTADPTGIQDLLAGTTPGTGLAAGVANLVNQYTDPINGALTSESLGLTKQIASYNTQISHIDDSATALQSRLQEEFTNLDTLMSTLNNQMTYINAAFSSVLGTSTKK